MNAHRASQETQKEPMLDAVVLAGGRIDKADPLYPWSGDGPKALIELAGKPMIQYVLAALRSFSPVNHVAVVGLPDGTELKADKRMSFLPDQGSLIANAVAGIRHVTVDRDLSHMVMICTADIPLVTSSAFAALLAACSPFGHTLYYPIVSRQALESSFPTSRRTYMSLLEGDYAGGDVVLVQAGITDSDLPFWEALTSARKSPLRQARLIGLPILIKALINRLIIKDIEKRALSKLGIQARAIPMSRPEIAMDVDKPGQLALVARALQRRQEANMEEP